MLTPDLQVDRAHTARMYDYWLGGKDNYEADRKAAALVEQAFPSVPETARANRGFMRRAALAVAEKGVTQFLDIGTGIPTAPNLHQIVQERAPATRVVYVDNDPLVLAHARALMIGTPEGRTAFIQSDFTRPDEILSAPQLRETLDLDQPVALSLVALLHFVSDEQDPYGVIARLVDTLVPGSYLIMSHATADFNSDAMTATEAYRKAGISATVRGREQFSRFFAGLEVLEPGFVSTVQWRPPVPATDALVVRAGMYAAVARKPG